MKLKATTRTLTKGFCLFFVVLASIFTIISCRVKSDIISHKLPSAEKIKDTAIIHFIHGSVPQKGCSYTRKRLGGYLGGHIEIELDEVVYDFLYETLPISVLPHRKRNSRFRAKSLENWTKRTENDKITSIYVPISSEQKDSLTKIFTQYLDAKPYDYAFFGQRCASSTAEILSDAGILSEFSNFQAVVSFFYPRPFRATMLSFAEKNNLKVVRKKGIDCHNWE